MQRRRLILFYFLLLLAMLVAALSLWTARTEEKAHFTPQYAEANLELLLRKEKLSREEYFTVFQQTGLSPAGVEELYEQGRQRELLDLQKRFLRPVEYTCCSSYLVCRSERLAGQFQDKADGVAGETGGSAADKGKNFLPVVHTGDILITFSGHVFGWRSGHAALVVDGEKRLTLEATTLGCDSEVCNMAHWSEYPCFILLRLKDISADKASEIASYALDELCDIPYNLAAFTGAAHSYGTQCAHLVWLAFYHFGYDLDSDGGQIVTPSDLYGSELLEVIQVYGMPIVKNL